MRGRSFAGIAALRNDTVVSRAAALPGGAIESSRSISRASAPLPMPLSSFLGLSPGMNRKERIRNEYDMLPRRSTRGLAMLARRFALALLTAAQLAFGASVAA